MQQVGTSGTFAGHVGFVPLGASKINGLEDAGHLPGHGTREPGQPGHNTRKCPECPADFVPFGEGHGSRQKEARR